MNPRWDEDPNAVWVGLVTSAPHPTQPTDVRIPRHGAALRYQTLFPLPLYITNENGASYGMLYLKYVRVFLQRGAPAARDPACRNPIRAPLPPACVLTCPTPTPVRAPADRGWVAPFRWRSRVFCGADPVRPPADRGSRRAAPRGRGSPIRARNRQSRSGAKRRKHRFERHMKTITLIE